MSAARPQAPSFFVLGSLEVSREGRRVEVPGRNVRALLALLLARANSVVAAEELVELFWGDRPLQDAANSLHVSASRLRKIVGAEVLRTTGRGYELVVPPDRLDADRFERLVEGGRGALAADDAVRARDALRAALALWRGRPFPELDDLAEPEIHRLEELRLVAVDANAEAALRLGGGAELVPDLERLVREHPLHERLRGQLAVALYRGGRQADA